jgi:UDP-N-acetylmuramoyl-L-alanyl-D-glutamate--2,6-diaminopimelate ligase
MAFAAIAGTAVDGRAFITDALARGAVLVLVEGKVDVPDLPWARVRDVRRSLSLLVAEVLGDPTRDFYLVGITGTDGKTSTAMLIEAGFIGCGIPAGLMGTVMYRYPGVSQPAAMTTPGPEELNAWFDQMRSAGVAAVAMEVSSHALAQRRVDGARFNCVVFMNLTRDHLDYHGTQQDYENAKMLLFGPILAESPDAMGAVINGDDPLADRIRANCSRPVIRWSHDPSGDAEIAPVRVDYSLDGIDAELRTPWGPVSVRTPLIGSHNLSNLMAAIGVAGVLGLSIDAFVEGACGLRVIPGRLERVIGRKSVRVFVDYAHTPKALDNVLGVLRPMVGGGRLTVVMGAGGDRDRGKRPLMGRAAATMADRVIVTSDNPRSEDPRSIVDQIVAGIEEARLDGLAVAPYEAIVDRREAIRLAIAGAEPGEVIVICGKGHELTQDIGGRKSHFSDVETAEEFLNG